MGYVKYWNFKYKPFEEDTNTRFFFEGDEHREALDRMLYVCHDSNMHIGMLTGEVGSGKTTTKTIFERSLPQQRFEVISLENSNFSFSDILFDIINKLSKTGILKQVVPLPDRNDKYMLVQVFKKYLDTLYYEQKRHLIITLDEAQQIEEHVIDELKNLTNISFEAENCLTLFLIGQPELREKIKKLKPVNQRIFLRFHLNNLDYKNMIKYIRHRLRVAGLENYSIFTDAAFECMFRETDGIPREINRLCKIALNYGYVQNLKEITDTDIQVVIDDIREHS
jgi:general secretion pathway protein A